MCRKIRYEIIEESNCGGWNEKYSLGVFKTKKSAEKELKHFQQLAYEALADCGAKIIKISLSN